MLEPAGEQENVLDPLPDCVPLQTTQQEMEKLKAQYRSLARDSAQAKRKYQEASKGASLSPARPPSFPHRSRMAVAPRTLRKLQPSLERVGILGVGSIEESPAWSPRSQAKVWGPWDSALWVRSIPVSQCNHSRLCPPACPGTLPALTL